MNPILAALFMAITDPGKPKRGIPGTPVKKLSPFVTDTLFPASGGPFRINRSYGFAPNNADAITVAPLRPAQGDTGVVFYGEPTDHLLAHETGHIVDNRGNAALALAGAAAGQSRYRRERTYWSNDRNEYIAEAFARAMQSGRKGFSDSTKVEKEMPGTIHLIRWLQTQPPFKK